MNCPKCKSAHFVKNGIVQDRQRFKCKDCNYNYTVEKKSDVKSAEVKRMALEMYLEGLGFRSIGRILRISYVTVFRWIKDWGKTASLPKSEGSVEFVELDEMHTYVCQKKTTDGYGLLLIDLEKGLSLLSVETEAPRQGKSFGRK